MNTRADNVDARIMGGELGVAYSFASNWKADATLAYAWGKNSGDDEALPQMPPLEARLGLSYQRDDWSVGALWRVVDGQGRIAEGRGNVVGQDLDESAGFGVFSLNGAYRLTSEVKLSAGVDNLFDKRYAEHLNLAGNAGFGFPATPVSTSRGVPSGPRSITTSELLVRRRPDGVTLAAWPPYPATLSCRG